MFIPRNLVQKALALPTAARGCPHSQYSVIRAPNPTLLSQIRFLVPVAWKLAMKDMLTWTTSLTSEVRIANV